MESATTNEIEILKTQCFTLCYLESKVSLFRQSRENCEAHVGWQGRRQKFKLIKRMHVTNSLYQTLSFFETLVSMMHVLGINNLILKTYLANVSTGCSSPPQGEMNLDWVRLHIL